LCDVCMQPINDHQPSAKGGGRSDQRYHCAECGGFDMCEKCFRTTAHPHHLWQEVPRHRRVHYKEGESKGVS
jgi:hypothetical protein